MGLEVETSFDVVVRLTESMLGTVPMNKDVYEQYIQSKVDKARESGQVEISDEELKKEVETVEELGEKGHTGFHKDDDGIFIYNYMIKGFLKSACEVCQAVGAVDKISAYKKWIDLLVFVEPRKIYFCFTEDFHNVLQKADDTLSRSIRTISPKGPRTSLMKSDLVEAGRFMKFRIDVLKSTKGLGKDSIEQMLDYGRFVGLGQWRGSGAYGRFEIVSIEDVAVAQ